MPAIVAAAALAAGALVGCGGARATPIDGTPTDGTGSDNTASDPAPAPALAAAVAVRAAGCRQAEELTGSGSVVGDELVVTVAHVVAGSSSVAVTAADGTELQAQVVGLDTVNDLALLAVDGLDVAPLPLGALTAGDEGVFVVHDASGRAIAQPATVTRRADLSMADLYGQGTHVRPGFELDAEVNPGDSGAVVVDADGRAGAVVFATSREAAGPGPAISGPGNSGPGPGAGGGTAHRAWATDIAALAPLLADPHDTAVPTGRCVE